MPKSGILSTKSFFPQSGDAFDELDGEMTWVCERAHAHNDEKTGTKIRYALLIGRHAALGDTPIPKLVDDSAMPLPLLKEIDVVHRTRGGERKTYVKNVKGNYEEA